jgi:hypothetical protein
MGDVTDAILEVREILDELTTGQTSDGQPAAPPNAKNATDKFLRIQELVAEFGLLQVPHVYPGGIRGFTVEGPTP